MIIQGPWKGERRRNPGRSADRRRQARARGLFGGKLYYGPGFTLDCSVHNLSKGGAKIKIKGHPGPDGFHLILIKHGLAMDTRAVWRGPEETGVRFLSAVDLDRPPAQHLAMRHLWMQLLPR